MGRFIYANLSQKLNSSEILPVNCKFICIHIFLFALKVRLKDLKFEIYQFKLEQNHRLIGKILLEFDFSISSLL